MTGVDETVYENYYRFAPELLFSPDGLPICFGALVKLGDDRWRGLPIDPLTLHPSIPQRASRHEGKLCGEWRKVVTAVLNSTADLDAE